ncbi:MULTISPECIES: cob(I)yrinic acid a,c-diamide adenosyltransferase [Caloramator]|uniref:Cob(I)alamin adenosyltransferase n=1 Tax=Caloramator australicus RC3 TaxID=857293 RepID=G0V4T0_9CLOT|nr:MULTISPECIES: cob(I)yrinic acid a,c-diamide adenosyltransferase [Caloramator]MDO6355081.1 cob(I)yrinic acid a,c-diamide adenosyltransferase [Caloramator sp. CAR-1]CCC58120.1 Cob(I)alamin adenosyltransferase [Caloramator australicus RC3]
MGKLTKGCIQVYTGDGKGKTTAAIGQGVRAAGNELRVYMVQFLKGSETGELKSIEKLDPYFKIFRFEKKRGFFWTLSDEEKAELKKEIEEAFEFCKKVLKNKECDVLILDEIMGVLHNKLLSVEEVVEFLKSKPEDMEIILTGRNVPKEIMEIADLVTEMKEIKHYFEKGVPARKGIEF